MGRRVLLALAVLLGVPAGALAQSVSSRWVDSIFAPYNRIGIPGCAVGVIQRGVVTYSRGFGEADLHRRAPNSPSTAFYVASLSKQFTAMSIVLLAQDQKLSLNDDIRRWVPEVPRLAPITLLDLLHHTSGIRDYYTLLGVTGWRSNGLFTTADLLALVRRQRALNFAPGEEFMYSNTGYALLGIVVERAAGKPLREFATERIFRPLGMTQTQFRDDHTQQIDAEAIGYLPTPGGYTVSIPQVDVVGDGGVFSTVEDLAKWDANLTTGTVGGPQAIRMMVTAGTLRDGTSTGYALGLNVGTYNGVRVASHSGAYGGYRSTYMRFPDERLSVITLCNVSAPSAQLTEQVALVHMPQAYRTGDGGATPTIGGNALNLAAKPTELPTGISRTIPEPDEQAWLEGTYHSEELDFDVSLRSKNGTLTMQRPGAEEFQFTRIARDFFMTGDQITLQVERDGRGVISGFALSTGRVRKLRFSRR